MHQLLINSDAALVVVKFLPEGVALFLVVDIPASFRARDVEGDSGNPVISLAYLIRLHTRTPCS